MSTTHVRAFARFDEEASHLGLVLAAHAAVALTGSQQQADLMTAAASRLVIGQAGAS